MKNNMDKKQLILMCLAVLCVMLGISYARRQSSIKAGQAAASSESTETLQEKEEQDTAPSESPETEQDKEEQAAESEEKTSEPEAEKESPGAEAEPAGTSPAKILYQGHASIRITTSEEKVIYIDPFAGDGYEPAADLILITHSHYDHNNPGMVLNRNPDCRTITWQEALADGTHQTFDLGYVTVEAVEAGYNNNHNKNECVGYVLTLSDGITVYVTGDTSKTEQMPLLAEKQIDYAFFCCDGVYNMDLEEAADCAALVQAKHNIPYHIVPADSAVFDREKAEQFQAENRLIVEAGEEIELKK